MVQVTRLVAVLVLCLGVGSCASQDRNDAPAPVALGVIRTVEAARLADPDQWGKELDLALETEFWDLIGNSAHDEYSQWHDKAKTYVAANPGADPRIAMFVSAGAVFSLTRLFQGEVGVNLGDFTQFIEDATTGSRAAVEPLTDHEPAVVFFHNNQAMLAFLLNSDADLGICHLEKLRNLEDSGADFLGTEGRAASPFTYGMINDEAYVDYAITLMEGCDTWICNWTSKLAPFKPIGQLMTLAEFHAVKAQMTGDPAIRVASYAEMNRLLDRAAELGGARNYPFLDRIERLRTELPTRTYAQGIGMGRSPMPIYSNETNCSNCHIGGIPGKYGEELEDPYPGVELKTAKPAPPPFMSAAATTCD